MDWGPVISALSGGGTGLLIMLAGKWWDGRTARVTQKAKADTDTARTFYANLIDRYDRLQKRCDELEQERNVIEAKLARAERAAETADTLCEAHERHLDEVYVAGQARFPGDWQSFLNNLRTPRPAKRGGRAS